MVDFRFEEYTYIRRLSKPGSFEPSRGTRYSRTARTVAIEEEILERIAEELGSRTNEIANQKHAA